MDMEMKKITPMKIKSNALWRLDKDVIKDVDETPVKNNNKNKKQRKSHTVGELPPRLLPMFLSF